MKSEAAETRPSPHTTSLEKTPPPTLLLTPNPPKNSKQDTMSQTLDADLEAILGGIEELPKQKEAAAAPPPPPPPPSKEEGNKEEAGGATAAAEQPPPEAAAAAPAAPASTPAPLAAAPAVSEASSVVPKPPAVASEVIEAGAAAVAAPAIAEKVAEAKSVVASAVAVPKAPAHLGVRRIGIFKRKPTAAPALAGNKDAPTAAAAKTRMAAAKTTTTATAAPSKAAPAASSSAAAAPAAAPTVAVFRAKNAYMLFSSAKQAEVRGEKKWRREKRRKEKEGAKRSEKQRRFFPFDLDPSTLLSLNNNNRNSKKNSLKKLSAANPTLSICEVSKLLGAQWREASEETKAHFAELAAASKVWVFIIFPFLFSGFFSSIKKKLNYLTFSQPNQTKNRPPRRPSPPRTPKPSPRPSLQPPRSAP